MGGEPCRYFVKSGDLSGKSIRAVAARERTGDQPNERAPNVACALDSWLQRGDKRMMKRFPAVGVALIFGLLVSSCSRKAAPVAPNAPEVLVTTVEPKDVPRVLERVATLDGFINANINAQVQGYIVSRDYHEGNVVKKGDLLFTIDPRPFEAALAQAKGTLAKDQANLVKADADKKRAIDLFKKKVISDSERDTAIAAADSSTANVEADKAAVQQAEINLSYTKITGTITRQ